jgi:hypothetical protein
VQNIYLVKKCFAQDMVYAPLKEWNSEEPPQRVYSQMHTADWWWKTHVGSDPTFHSPSIPDIGMQIDNQQRIDCQKEQHWYQLYVPQMSPF